MERELTDILRQKRNYNTFFDVDYGFRYKMDVLCESRERNVCYIFTEEDNFSDAQQVTCKYTSGMYKKNPNKSYWGVVCTPENLYISAKNGKKREISIRGDE